MRLRVLRDLYTVTSEVFRVAVAMRYRSLAARTVFKQDGRYQYGARNNDGFCNRN
jgi:hypothetical protein